VDCIRLAQVPEAGCCERGYEPSSSLDGRKFRNYQSEY
jgi:hypothetical protein